MSTGTRKKTTQEDNINALVWLKALLLRDERWGKSEGFPPKVCIEALSEVICDLTKDYSKEKEKMLEEIFDNTYKRHPKNPDHPNRCKKCGTNNKRENGVCTICDWK